ncbi:uveal autoantigen with coiled-coil domains and ankyrin repeats protein-like isoform X2 [Megalops cyprinoides]|uniref:uveal autoantigen with coiled-coil domains and ankyrin repeats protein-like isoform X2 n=1 Tax=Megalops cyprinoides TaxID=118141 RepID=UPI001863AB6B|nr:uveal autoantigen with coiled-coil domains and ankyrin repeats protein-like isoform X2 [Megalops cyprinoides]
MSRWLKCTSSYFNADWNKHDERLMKAVERGEVDKVAAVLNKKGVVPTKLDPEGRSAFHLAATRGHLDCLSLILGHNVDATATDSTGKSALHLAARNGHSQCVQKLLQHNCPVGKVDLNGRTALHDAVIAGSFASVELLCDSGAAVHASDSDGRTPLVLATQMCHPQICQLLLERGADIAARDKQNKTALILGCEYACKDAVEVLLKGGADVTAVDGLGHDSYHYARLSKNPELVGLVKDALDSFTQAKEAAKMELKRLQVMNAEGAGQCRAAQDVEKQRESQQEALKKKPQEQRVLLDQLHQLQQQLSQEKSSVEHLQKERDQLRMLLSSKEREDGARVTETVKVQHKSLLGDYSGQSVIKGKEHFLVKQSHSLDSAEVLQSSPPLCSGSRPLEVSRAGVAWLGEAELARKRQEAVEQEVSRLQEALASKSRECEELAQIHEEAQRSSDRQVQELEEALSDVQRRMMDSEAKVKQLQAHVVAMKDRLQGPQADELRAQLHDVKAKYEGASAEVGRVRNQLKQSEQALEEYRKSEGVLAREAEELAEELGHCRQDREEMGAVLADMEACMKEMEAKMAAAVSGEKFDNMKNLLTNAVDEKERQLAELREDYDRVLEEAAELHRELDEERARGGERQGARDALEQQNAALRRRLADVTAKSKALISELELSEEEAELLRERVRDLGHKMQTEHVPLETHQEVAQSLERAAEEVRRELAERVRKGEQLEAELRQLRAENGALNDTVTRLQGESADPERVRSEVGVLSSRNAELEEELVALQGKCQEKERELGVAAAKGAELKQSLQGQYVSREEHERVSAELSRAMQEAQALICRMEAEARERAEELRNVQQGRSALEGTLRGVEAALARDYVSLKDHEEMQRKLEGEASEAESRASEARREQREAQEEMRKLNEAIEDQKRELDSIQEAILSRFVPLSDLEEKESALRDTLRELEEAQRRCDHAQEEAQRHEQEKETLRVELVSLQRRIETDFVPREEHQQMEQEHRSREEQLSRQVEELDQQYQDIAEQNAQSSAQIQDLQRRLVAESARVQRLEEAQRSLSDVRAELQREADALRGRAERAAALEAELQSRSDGAALLEDVTALQAEKLRLEEEAAALTERLSLLSQRCEEARREVARAREGENRARAETEALRAQSSSIQSEIGELKERYDQSLSTIGDLQRRVHTSSELTQAKDKKISELLADVEGLKQALSGLSQLAYSGSTPSKQNQNRDTLQAQVQSLQQQLADAERQHREVVSIYRTHLLSAAQGHMDADVQAALLQIIRMRQEFVC